MKSESDKNELAQKDSAIVEESKAKFGIRFAIGDIVLDKNGYYKKCVNFYKDGIQFLSKTDDGWETINPEYPQSGTVEWHYVKEYLKINLLPNESIEEYEKRMQIEAIDFKDEDVEESKKTELTKFDKNYYVSIKNELVERQSRFEIMQRVLEKKRWEMQQVVQKFEKQLIQVKKVLWTIELYLGIEEEIVQLQSGEHCTPDIPISFRQHVLYMDEEVAVAEHENIEYQGIDFQEIEKFDNWLITDKNYDKIIPEPKGVVILRVRRNDKNYHSGNFWDEIAYNQQNKVTYILIKNGENIYRIWADIIIHPKLFPSESEMNELFETIENENGHSCDKDGAKNRIFTYQQCLALMQGLIERTPIFHPMPHPINLFKPETYEDGSIQFIYDDALCLPDNRLPYKEWKKKINSQIARGSRIYFCGFRYDDISVDSKYERYNCTYFDGYYTDSPKEGVYTVEDIVKRRRDFEMLKCKWESNSEVGTNWGYDYHKRKNLVSMYLFPDEWYVLNYDLMTLEDVEYYIQSRIERPAYLDVLPMLFRIKRARLEEMNWEQGLIDSLRIKFKLIDTKLIAKVIEWWKHKVIWKRPITKEDAKAVRMIERKISSLLKNNKAIEILDAEIKKYQQKIDEFNADWNLKYKNQDESK